MQASCSACLGVPLVPVATGYYSDSVLSCCPAVLPPAYSGQTNCNSQPECGVGERYTGDDSVGATAPASCRNCDAGQYQSSENHRKTSCNECDNTQCEMVCLNQSLYFKGPRPIVFCEECHSHWCRDCVAMKSTVVFTGYAVYMWDSNHAFVRPTPTTGNVPHWGMPW